MMSTEQTARDLAELVAPALSALTGDTWAPDHRYDHDARLVRNSSDVALYLNMGASWAPAGKVKVSGAVPDGAEYSQGDTRDWNAGEINVSVERGADAIAREIVRRCLPGYLQSHADVTERIAKRHTAQNAAAAMAARFADALGTAAWERGNDGWRAPIPAIAGGYGDFKPSYDGTSAYVELRGIPSDLALKLAKLIRKASEQ